MDNKKRNIHNSGPLGILMQKGQIHKIEEPAEHSSQSQEDNSLKKVSSYFKTDAGIEFTENELLYVDPKECEPWKYANRHEKELGDINDLIESIRINKQLQPALVRKHPTPHDEIKYEIIFGRRRHIACLKLGIPFLVICKKIPHVQDAIASQDAENKFRRDVSNYSNAILYKRILEDEVFKTEKDLADKLGISRASLSELLTFTKIPESIITKIKDPHSLSKSMAIKIVQLISIDSDNRSLLESLAPCIGEKLTSPSKLEREVEKIKTKDPKPKDKSMPAVLYKSKNGVKLFSFKLDRRGLPSFVIHKDVVSHLDAERVCKVLREFIEEEMDDSDIRT